jgi:hypothetical protein
MHIMNATLIIFIDFDNTSHTFFILWLNFIFFLPLVHHHLLNTPVTDLFCFPVYPPLSSTVEMLILPLCMFTYAVMVSNNYERRQHLRTTLLLNSTMKTLLQVT